MNIVTQNKSLNPLTSLLLDNKLIKNIINPRNTSFSATNYASFIEETANTTSELIRQSIVDVLEKMDDDFRYDPQRLTRFYVKVKRPRTLITPFGVISFNRTIYKSRFNNSYYTHVDESLGLPKYDRYDPCVKAMIVEAYANTNSMIKVGKMIGDRIYSSFSLNPLREHYSISRQTVFNILKNSSILDIPIQTVNHTPSSITIMADEKYIPTQRNNGLKQMVKAATIFESFKTVSSRNTLTNKYVYFNTSRNFWDNILDIIHQRYDFQKIETINILGDGASWIKTGVNILKTSFNQVTFSLDKFHFKQAINRITNHKGLKEVLISYVYNDDIKTFRKLCKALVPNNELLLPKASESIKYIYNHWKYIQNTLHHLKIPCSMESAISHNLASQFTSVPKAYHIQNLDIYLNHRMHHLNHIDLRSLFIESLDYKKENNTVKVYSPLDFSFFDKRNQYDKSSNSKWLKGFIAKH